MCFWLAATAGAQTTRSAPPSPGKPQNTVSGGDLLDAVKNFVVGGETTNKVVHLFSGVNLDHFYVWLAENGTYVDPFHVFSVTNRLLRISGEQKGYLATKEQFADYHLVVEYKWGTMKWGDQKVPRNSGVLIHATGLDKLWMKALECQIAEGRTGEAVVHGGEKLQVGDVLKSKPYDTFARITTEEVEFSDPNKWNRMDVVCQGNGLVILVNGQKTMEAINAFPNSGKILLQSNGAEIFFRRIDLIPLSVTSAPPSSTH